MVFRTSGFKAYSCDNLASFNNTDILAVYQHDYNSIKDGDVLHLVILCVNQTVN